MIDSGETMLRKKRDGSRFLSTVGRNCLFYAKFLDRHLIIFPAQSVHKHLRACENHLNRDRSGRLARAGRPGLA
jgi:hypothetical protein